MGSLWVAEHLRLRMHVVVKFIASELADNPEACARFEREASATMAAKSANVVQILDYGFTEEGVPFIAMELLEGENLETKIARDVRIGPVEFAEILRQASRGLTRAHAQGIVHRDIKPENIFLSHVDGEICVKVLDFGVAKSDNAALGLGATKTGALLGTACYMSPEQTMGAKNVDHRTDLWSLAVVAYYALTGTRPFEAESIGVLVNNIMWTPIVPPSHHVPALGESVDYWMLQALSRNPPERFASARDMSAAFDSAVAKWREAMGSAHPATPLVQWGIDLLTPPPEPLPEPPMAMPQSTLAAATPPGEWNRAHGYGPVGGVGATQWGQGQKLLPAAISTGSGLYGAAVANAGKPRRSYAPVLVGIGIGVTVCLSVIVFLGRGTPQAPQAVSAAPEVTGVDAKAVPEPVVSPPIPGGERAPGLGFVRPGDSTATMTATAPASPRTSGSRAVEGTSRARSSAAKGRPQKRAPARVDNPFNGTY